jgi:hypothetical protein
MAARIPPPQTPGQQQLAAAVAADLQEQAEAIVQEVADLLAAVPEAQLFGDTEFLVRDKVLQLVARAYRARLAQKKRPRRLRQRLPRLRTNRLLPRLPRAKPPEFGGQRAL